MLRLITWGKIGQKGPAVAELPGEGGMDPEKSVRDLAAPGQEITIRVMRTSLVVQCSSPSS